MDLWHDLREQYLEFAGQARDSPCFAEWSRAVADDPAVLTWLETLPRIKQQPNLVFAAARVHGVPAPGPYSALREALLGDDAADGPIRTTILERSTQTNEVGRLATLLPAFGEIALRHDGAPLALLEVGASAGLCLFPDRYRYRWRTDHGEVTLGVGPGLECRVEGPAPLPSQALGVAARLGVDLHPLDVRSDADVEWLKALVWPEHDDRRARLRDAVGVARSDPPRVERGDLLQDLPRLVEQASAHGPVVVFHSAVIAYLDDDQRTAFDVMIRGLVRDDACHWVSNESSRVLPSVTATATSAPPDGPTFVLGLDGEAVAWTHGHGRALSWLS